MQYHFLNGSLSVGNNNTIVLKVFFGHDVVYRTVQYTNTLLDLSISGVEVSTNSLGLQYPSPTLFASKEGKAGPFYLGTLSYNATADYAVCKSILCSVLPSEHAYGSTMETFRVVPSPAMIEQRMKQKELYHSLKDQYAEEELTWG